MVDKYFSPLYKVSFQLPFRWAVVEGTADLVEGKIAGPGDYLNITLEPTEMEHNVQVQIEKTGFAPQVLVLSEERDPR